MPQTRATAATSTPAMTPTEIQKLIADSVAAALETQAATMARASSTNRPTGENEVAVTGKCTYKDFMACKPT